MKHDKLIADRLKKLKKAVTGANRPLILIYGNPDPDALASAWALKEIMHSAGAKADIRYTGEFGRLENETMVKVLQIPAEPLKENELAGADLVALVDSQPDFFKPVELPRCDIVIDHHPRKTSREYLFSDIRPNCLATSLILTEYLRISGLRVSAKLATALYYGIQTDRQNVKRWPTSEDTEAILYLQRKASKNILRKIEFSSYSLGRLDYFSIALTKIRYAKGVLYSHVGPVPYTDVCVQIADFLTRVKEAKWAVVSGVVRDKLIIIFRCDGHNKHAGKTANAAFGNMGSAGGHVTMGRAEILNENMPRGIYFTDNEKVEKFVLREIARVEKEFGSILRVIPE
ncbi:MAG: DHH family phosphoesterase [Deltaproteobacteria bacterium]|nr:MAG: DHH family phosphoesterase [Deltaproteobacteria bacterium]